MDFKHINYAGFSFNGSCFPVSSLLETLKKKNVPFTYRLVVIASSLFILGGHKLIFLIADSIVGLISLHPPPTGASFPGNC